MQWKCLTAVVCLIPAFVAGDAGAAEASMPWCESAGGCDEYVSRVTIAEIDNTSGCVGYSDFTDSVAYLEIGHFYQLVIEISRAYSRDSGGVWVDWNHNHMFDEPEEEILLEVDGGFGPYHGILLVPTDAQTVETYLRVRLCYYQTPRPCGITNYGEVEDYNVSISGAPYLCGDAGGDSAINVGDVVYLINYIFRSGPEPDPPAAGDADCNHTVNIADAVYLIAYIFSGGQEPCCR